MLKFDYKFKIVVLALVWLITAPFINIFADHAVQSGMIILVFAALLWMTEALPLPVTALMIPLLAIVFGLLDPVAAFANFANPIIFLFLGGFVLAGALSKYKVDQLISSKMLSIANGNFVKSSILLMVASALLSMWVSNTSTAIMMLPVALGLLNFINKQGTTAESKFLLLGIAYAANIGGVATLIGSPPNAIGASVLSLSFVQWLKFGIPVFLFTFPVMILVLYFYFKPDRKLSFPLTKVETEIKSGKFPLLIGIFGITILLWLLDGPISNFLNISGSFSSMVAIFAIFLIIATNLLTWKDIQEKVDWGVLILFGGGLTLGAVLSVSGFGEFIANKIVSVFGNINPVVFLWIIVLTSILFTEFMSNTASAALFVPILYTISLRMDMDPLLFVLPATIAATYGFMLPVGTPPNAVVFGTGRVPQQSMIRVGMILNILFSIMITLLAYFFL
jgi:solute carrier family 13 (sodium-dependent dicarboxylate transporter), member 2/3/5